MLKWFFEHLNAWSSLSGSRRFSGASADESCPARDRAPSARSSGERAGWLDWSALLSLGSGAGLASLRRYIGNMRKTKERASAQNGSNSVIAMIGMRGSIGIIINIIDDFRFSFHCARMNHCNRKNVSVLMKSIRYSAAAIGFLCSTTYLSAQDVSGFRHSSNNGASSASYILGAVDAKVDKGVLSFTSDRTEAVMAYIHDANGNIVKKIVIPGKLDSNFSAAYDAVVGIPSDMIAEATKTYFSDGQKKFDLKSSRLADYLSNGSKADYESSFDMKDFPPGGSISYGSGTPETIAATVVSSVLKTFTTGISVLVGNDGTDFVSLTFRAVFDKMMSDPAFLQKIALLAAEGRLADAGKETNDWLKKNALPAIIQNIQNKGMSSYAEEKLILNSAKSAAKLFGWLEPLANGLVAASSIRDAALQMKYGPHLLWFDMPYDSQDNLKSQYKFNWNGTPLKETQPLIWENKTNEKDQISYWKFWRLGDKFEAEYDRYKVDDDQKPISLPSPPLPPTAPPQEPPATPPQVPPVTPPVVTPKPTPPVVTPTPIPTPPTPPVVTSSYDYKGIFAAKLSGAQSFVGLGISLKSAFDPLVSTTATVPKRFALTTEPGALFSSYFNSDRGISPQVTDIGVWMDKSARSEGTIIGAPAASNQTYKYLYFGEYIGSDSDPITVTGDNYSRKVGAAWWLLGQPTAAASVPQGGQATYQGGVNGIATNGEEIVGRVSFDVNFASKAMSGWMHLRRQDTTRWGLATFSSVTINGGRFHASGSFQSYLAVPPPGGSVSPGDITMSGGFYGKAAEEMGGGWSLWNTHDALMGAAGIFRAKSGFGSEAAPPPPQTQTQTPGAAGSSNAGFLGGRRVDGMLFTTDLIDTGTSVKTSTNAQAPGCCSQTTIAQSTVTPVVNSTTLGSYQYVAWGDWNGEIQRTPSESSPVSASGKWVYGRATTFDEVPKSGSATYRGEIAGVASNGEKIGGDIALLARFGKEALWNGPDIEWQGNFKRANGSAWLTVAESPVPFTGGAFASNWGGFAKTPSGDALPNVFGHITGRLYGTQGQEIAGVWSVQNVPGDIGYANGVFRAKK